MVGEEERSEEEGSFSKASIPKRISIVLAGGLVNIIFGLLVYFILVSSTGNYISTNIESISPDYAAEQSDLQVGDKILKINNKKVRLRSDIDASLQSSKGKEITITIQRQNEIKTVKLIPTEEISKNIGIYLGIEGENLTSEIKSLYENGPAKNQGLQVGDVITKIDGIECKNDPYKIVELISNSQGEKISIEIERAGEIKTVEISPEIQKSYKIGVTFALAENTFLNNTYYGFWDTIDFSISIIDNLKMLLSGRVSTDQLMGPIGISEVVSKTDGLVEFIYLLALISLSLRSNKLAPISTTRWR